VAFYRLSKILVIDELRSADGIYTNRIGAWLGQIEDKPDETIVVPYTDSGGGYIMAPNDWYQYAEPIVPAEFPPSVWLAEA